MSITTSILRMLETKNLEKKLTSLTTIGKRLKFLREDVLHTNPTALAKQIGLNKNMINKYESEQFEPKIERVRQFAAFYDLPVEYITGESSTILLKEDYFLIANLQCYCWSIVFLRLPIDNINILEQELLHACKLVIHALINHHSGIEDYQYIQSEFSLDKDYSMIDYTKPESFIKFFDQKLHYLEEDEANTTKLLIPLSKVLDYAICTKDIINKSEYNEIFNTLPTLISLYQQYEKEQLFQD